MFKPQQSFSIIKSLGLYPLFKKHPNIFYIFKWLILSALVGLGAGVLSAVFLKSLDWATQYRENHSWLIYLLPVAGLFTGMLYYYLGKDVEAGNNLILDSIHRPKAVIPFKMAPMVLLGTIVTHLFGGSAGREGTALQMAGAYADQLFKPLGLKPRDRKILLIAGVSAGFSSVFGTPLAGAVFGLEVFLLGQISYAAIFPAFAAAIIADLTTRSFNVAHTHYSIGIIPELSASGFFYALIAGIAFGVAAIFFIRITHFIADFLKQKIGYAPFRSFAGGIMVLLLIVALGTTKYIGLGISGILSAFDHAEPAYSFVLKILLTAITLGSGFKGGEVTPLFFIGATLGSALSFVLPLPVGLLAGMGFVAVFAGATNTPLACCLMAVELFGAGCGVFVAIACVVSYLFSGHRSIYKSQVIGQPKHLLFGRMSNHKIGDFL